MISRMSIVFCAGSSPGDWPGVDSGMDSGESVMARMSINGAQREDGVASEIADLLLGVQQKKYRSAHMTGNSSASTRTISSIPADDLQRTLTLVRPNEDQAL